MPARIPGLAALAAACCLTLAAPAAPAAEPIGKMMTRTYSVADLVIPLTDFGVVMVRSEATATKPSQTQEKELIALITHTCSPLSWYDRDGPGTIDYFPLTMALVVNQTPDVQEQIAELLGDLRRMQDLEVALEVRIVSVAEDFCERVGVNFNQATPGTSPNLNVSVPTQFLCGVPANPSPTPDVSTPIANTTFGQAVKSEDGGCKDKVSVAFLNDTQVRQFLEATQGDTRTNVMQAPKVTLFNGQTGKMQAIDSQHYLTGVEIKSIDGQLVGVPKNEPIETGFRMTARPVISADRRFVNLNLKVEMTELDSGAIPLMPVTVSLKDNNEKTAPFTQFLQQPKVSKMTLEKTIAIPDGGTVLFGGLKKVVETRSEFGPPMLSKIPYVNRLFKNVGFSREEQQVLVLVTPRIIVNEQEEVKAQPRDAIGCARAQVMCPAAPCAVVPAAYLGQSSSEVLPPPTPKTHNTQRQKKVLVKLLKAYDAACAEGETDEAEKYAQAALSIDPTCFHKKR